MTCHRDVCVQLGPAGSKSKPDLVRVVSEECNPFMLPRRKKCKRGNLVEKRVLGFTLRFIEPAERLKAVMSLDKPFRFTGDPSDVPMVLETPLDEFSDDEDEAENKWEDQDDEAPKTFPRRFMKGALASTRPYAQEMGEQSRPGGRRRVVPWGLSDEEHLQAAKEVTHPVDRESLVWAFRRIMKRSSKL